MRKIKNLFILITLVLAVPAFFGSQHIVSPEGSLVQFFFMVILSVIDSLALGAGAAFLLLAWPLIRNITIINHAQKLAVYLSIAWILVSWWPHNNLHTIIAGSIYDDHSTYLTKLLLVEYGFHVTLMIAGGALASVFFSVLGKFYKEQ